MRNLTIVLFTAVLSLGFATACGQDEGPMESAGQAMDEAADNVGDAARDAADAAGDAARDAADAAGDAVDDIKEKMEE